MTSFDSLLPPQAAIHSPLRQSRRCPVKTRWHYGKAYVVIAAIAPFVLVSLLLVHLHRLGVVQWHSLRRGFSDRP